MNGELFCVHFKAFAHARHSEMIAKECKILPMERTEQCGERTMARDVIKDGKCINAWQHEKGGEY